MATVTVTAPSTVLQPTQSVQATVVTLDAAGSVLTGRVINWSSSNAAVASVSPLGSVTALASGTTTITVVSEGKSASITITVPPVATVAVATPQTNLQPTQTTQASATLLDASAVPAINRTVTWSSTNPAAATVSATGLVTAGRRWLHGVDRRYERRRQRQQDDQCSARRSRVTVTGTNLLAELRSRPLSSRPRCLDASSAPALNRTVTWSNSSPSAVATGECVTGLVNGAHARYGSHHRDE